jgi:hypothetical protein
MGTPNMQIKVRSSVIGGIPRPKTRGTVRRRAGREVFGETIEHLIDRTIALWQPRLRRDLSREDARQIAENVTGFFSILHEWSRASMPAPDNDNREPPVTRDSGEERHDR